MSKIVYLPLDERPCNYKYPKQLAAMTDVSFITPSKSILGEKKKPGHFVKIQEWLLEATRDANYLILSLDSLIYGGIVPSRLHYLSKDTCLERLSIIHAIKKQNPAIKIYAFNLIMRVPNNNRDEEEPDYYEYYGKNIWKYGWLLDKQTGESLTTEEEREFNQLKEIIPEEVIQDFVQRREVNKFVNNKALDYLKDGGLDYLVIPLDDNSEYGFSAKEQRELLFKVHAQDLTDRVMIYPGADDIGCSLFSKVFCEIKNYVPEIYIRYSSTLGPYMKPKYEDRSLNESVKSQVTAAGGVIADQSTDTYIILAINSPSTEQWNMAEQGPYESRHPSYYSEINYLEFVEAIKNYVRKEKYVSIADVALCNGADEYLMKLLEKKNLLNKLAAYAGWNTSGNTLGTVIPHAIIDSYNCSYAQNPEFAKASRAFFYSRLIEDWGFQATVRGDVVDNHLPTMDASYFKISHVYDDVVQLVEQKLAAFIADHFHEENLSIQNVHLPWIRMFEVDFELMN
ncbi:hypothetical protein J14TS2_20550 [Bacillus sp. J14TS2]|uniref:DUF4127 family protein n=1 Tax=Bacillus sp. J14TS2 TaxID=2807188 RepID=UPI001B11F34F|nr:DUF4127 family protein [Bacillus sp. J14TS2]GIN71580.1 hypothetical protein J14TS2_20550 [Bacillus sp. J14TS2]